MGKNGAEGLVYATKGEIYLHLDDGEILLARRKEPVWALAFHGEGLFDAGRNRGVFNTIEGKHGKIVKQYDGDILDLCSHNGNLYGCTCGDSGGQIFNALTGEIVVSRSGGYRFDPSSCVINGKEHEYKNFGGTRSLCSVDGKLYETNGYGNVVDSFANEIVKDGYERDALYLHKGVLLSARHYSKIEEVFSGKKVASRKFKVSKLCTHNNELYDCGHYNQICHTFTGEGVLTRDHWITALCSIDSELVGRILKKN